MRSCCLTVALLLTTVVLHADNWPQWRGPTGIGVTAETGLPDRWSESQAVVWRVKLDGMGVSTPVVWGDQVIATSQGYSSKANALGGIESVKNNAPDAPVVEV